MRREPALGHEPADRVLRDARPERGLDATVPVPALGVGERPRHAGAQPGVLADAEPRVVEVVAAGRDTAASMSATSANTSASAGRPASSSPGSTGAAGRRPGLFLRPRTASRINAFPRLQLPYPPTQHIRVIAQRLAIGSGLRHGIPPFRSPAPPFHRRGTVSSNDAPHRRRRQAPSPPASAAYRTGTIPPRDTASPTVWAAWGRHPHTWDRRAATVPGHCLVGYPRCSTTCFVDIDVEKYNSTARSRSSRPDTATILPHSLQENVRSPLSKCLIEIREELKF